MFGPLSLSRTLYTVFIFSFIVIGEINLVDSDENELIMGAGDFEAAIFYYRKSLSMSPHKLWIYESLVECVRNYGKYTVKDWNDIYVEMESELSKFNDNGNISNNSSITEMNHRKMSISEHSSPVMVPGRSAIYFALYQAAEYSNRYKDAWKYLEIAINLEKRRRNKLNPFAAEQLIDNIMKRFTREFFEAMPITSYTEPIFIVGMPESGTSLLEAILDTHPSIFGLGANRTLFEQKLRGRIDYLKFFSIFYDNVEHVFGSTLDALQPDSPQLEQTLNHIREKILKEHIGCAYNSLSDTSVLRHVVDTNPLLYKYLGYVQVLFPKALVVNVMRDPMDTIFGCMRKNHIAFYQNEWCYYDSEATMTYINYLNIMAYYRMVLPPGRIIDISADALLDDPQAVLAPILELLELEVHPDMLKFKVPSEWTGRGQWRRYRRELAWVRSDIRDPLSKLLKSGLLPLENQIDWLGRAEPQRSLSTCVPPVHNEAGDAVEPVSVPRSRDGLGRLLCDLGLRRGLVVGGGDGSEVAQLLKSCSYLARITVLQPPPHTTSSTTPTSSLEIEVEASGLGASHEAADMSWQLHLQLLRRKLSPHCRLLEPGSPVSESTITDPIPPLYHSSLPEVVIQAAGLAEYLSVVRNGSFDFLVVSDTVQDYCTAEAILHHSHAKIAPGGVLFGSHYYHIRLPTYHPKYDSHNYTGSEYSHKTFVSGPKRLEPRRKPSGKEYRVVCLDGEGSWSDLQAPRGVRGAVDDFADGVGLEVFVTDHDDPKDLAWILRKPCS